MYKQATTTEPQPLMAEVPYYFNNKFSISANHSHDAQIRNGCHGFPCRYIYEKNWSMKTRVCLYTRLTEFSQDNWNVLS